MINIRKWLIYLAYIIVVIVFFAYYLFPSDKVKEYITFKVNSANLNYNISINKLEPAFPPGLVLYNIELYRLSDFLINVEKIKIIPKLLSFFSPETSFCFRGTACEGVFEGIANVEESSTGEQIMIDAKLAGIQIRDIPAVKNLIGNIEISGMLGGKVGLASKKGSFNTLGADLNISDCRIKLLMPFFSPYDFNFRSIKTVMAIKKNTLQIDQCIIRGEQLDGSITGSVFLKDPVGKSVLNLKGTFKPQTLFLANLRKVIPLNLPLNYFSKNASNESNLPISISGTIDKPDIYLR